jgi:hypothetical protein
MLLGILIWLIPFGSFVIFEANAFRNKTDHWPSFSQLVKWWEGSKPRGIATWTWKRWSVALVLPAIAVVLELHLVWQVF